MTLLGSVLETAGDQLGGFLPRLGGAVVLLVAGWLVARIVAGVLRKLGEAAGADDLADRAGVNRVLERAGLGSSLVAVVARAIRLALIAVVVFAALSLLGLQFLSEALNQAVLFLPRALVAAAIVLAGVVLGAWARERVDRLATQMDLPFPAGQIAQGAVIVIAAVTAAAQIGVAAAVLTGLVSLVVGGVVLTFALAFGLGGRESARALSAGRHVRAAFDEGDEVEVAGVRGRVVELDPVALVLDAGDGSRVRVPNHLLVDEVVRVHDRRDAAS